ncbi:2'-5' RNA ligase family protein [uncultured Formosa sp.]|uniref:2'-5' RNA ligase family protein n=1 Tax=uncultured Formosa sp. TaxID=255435 RepID=UPI002611FD81|nr:2'-5' RNA ligase family protein [uncultured Formosa sp.]
MNEIRKQLTLFVEKSNENIEKIRAEFNPIQYNLISCHITLCREDEIEPIEKIIKRIKAIHLKKPISIKLNRAERCAGGKGVLLPATENNIEFRELRETILGTKLIKEQFPHVTLMHPRNSTCNEKIFTEIKKQELPTELFFHKISLIEQRNGGKWNVIEEYTIVNNNIS